MKQTFVLILNWTTNMNLLLYSDWQCIRRLQSKIWRNVWLFMVTCFHFQWSSWWHHFKLQFYFGCNNFRHVPSLSQSGKNWQNIYLRCICSFMYFASKQFSVGMMIINYNFLRNLFEFPCNQSWSWNSYQHLIHAQMIILMPT